MRWKFAMTALVAMAGAASAAAEDDPAVAAAIAACPGAAGFVRVHGDPSRASGAAPLAGVPAEPALRTQLLETARVDQQARNGDWSPAAIQRMNDVDAANLPEIKRIVADHDGLPGAGRIGADGVAAAWLLVQHADRDPAFQADVLAHIAPLLDSGQVSRQEMALLTDRVLVNQGRPQRYGSQLLAVDGRWEPKPMEAPAQVDQRRAAIGQMPLADYVCVASKLMPPPPTP